MKKQILIVALTFGAILFGTNHAQAQNTATTTVNITLNDVISIDAGSTAIGNTVDFNYATAADYNSDQTITKANSLKVTSTKNFNVKVKAGGASFEWNQLNPCKRFNDQSCNSFWNNGRNKERCCFIFKRSDFSFKRSTWKRINTEP